MPTRLKATVLELSYFKFLGRHQFALTAGFDTRDYDANNPVFNTKLVKTMK